MSAVKDFYPLSPLQEGMLFHSMMGTSTGVYVKQATYVLRGELNIPALERAWQDAVDRFAILRTFFVWEDLKKPVQVVQSDVKVTLHVEDWSNLPEAEAEQRLHEYGEVLNAGQAGEEGTMLTVDARLSDAAYARFMAR